MRFRFISVFTQLMITLLFLPWSSAFANFRLNMPKGVTPISQDIYYLHMTIFWICVAIGVVVFGVLTYAIIRHRKSIGHQAAQFHDSLIVEIIWIVIPFLILIGMAIPATIVLYRMDDVSKDDLTVKITGYQWKWRYEYLDYGINFFSNLSTPIAQIHNKAPKDKWYLLEVDHPLVLPIHEKIRFLVTANDVIHSWWVPELGIKRDGIPGFINEAWARINKPGTYRGQCAELCGMNHGYMPIVVIAKTKKDFLAWVAEQQNQKTIQHEKATQAQNKTYTIDELMVLGKKRYETYCAACHQASGLGLPPTFPALKGSSVATGRPISRHIDIILKGIPGTAMQAFGPQLNDDDIAAIATYERNAWGNNTGDLIRPNDVAAERAKG